MKSSHRYGQTHIVSLIRNPLSHVIDAAGEAKLITERRKHITTQYELLNCFSWYENKTQVQFI